MLFNFQMEAQFYAKWKGNCIYTSGQYGAPVLEV